MTVGFSRLSTATFGDMFLPSSIQVCQIAIEASDRRLHSHHVRPEDFWNCHRAVLTDMVCVTT